MTFAMPSTVVPSPDERELLVRFLHRQREEVVATADGLTEGQARWRPEGRLLPILGIINHLAHAEWRWIEGRFLGREFPARVDEFAAQGMTLSDACAAYWDQAQRTDEIVRAAPSLHTACLGREALCPQHMSFSGSRNRSTSGGQCCISSRRPLTTPVTQTQHGRCSTAESCDPEPHDRAPIRRRSQPVGATLRRVYLLVTAGRGFLAACVESAAISSSSGWV